MKGSENICCVWSLRILAGSRARFCVALCSLLLGIVLLPSVSQSVAESGSDASEISTPEANHNQLISQDTLKQWLDLWSGSLPIDTFVIRDISFHSDYLTLERIAATLSLSQSGDAKTLEITKGTIGSVVLGKRSTRDKRIFKSAGFHGAIRWKHDTIEVLELLIVIPNVGQISARGNLAPENGQGHIIIQAYSLELGPLLSGLFSLPADFSLSFPTDLKVAFTSARNNQWNWEGTMELKGGRFQDPSLFHGGEKLILVAGIKGLLNPTKRSQTLDFSLRLKSGEMLLDKLYFNFAKTPLTLHMKASSPDDFEQLTLHFLDIRLDPIWSARLDGFIGDLHHLAGANLQLISKSQWLQPLLQKFVQEPLGDSYPSLDRLEASGRWETRLNLKGDLLQPEITGNLTLQQVSLIHPERNSRLTGLNCEFPIWFNLDQNSPKEASTPSIAGMLRFDSFDSPHFKLPSLSVPVQAFPDGWRITDEIIVPYESEHIRISDLELKNVLSPDRTGHLSIRIDRLPLGDFFDRLFQSRVEALLHTRNWGLKLEGNRLESFGSLLIDAFSGQFQVENFGIERLFSPARVLSMDVACDNIDLLELTRMTQFGRITGRLRGKAEDLRISYGAPIAFDLKLESARRKGVRQRISLTALENLTQLGSGQSPFQGMAGLMTVFFKEFSYQKIGIRCILNNDFFTIRGLIREGGTEYLVKRGALGGVNVVNQHPNNRISWSDMMRRLKRIGRTEEQPMAE